jgi:hypothetical protein
MNITLAEYRKHAYSSRPSAGESCARRSICELRFVAGPGARKNYESNYPVCWIGIPAAQLDRARCHHESHNIEKFKRKAGGRYAADLVLQLPARGSGSVALHCDYQNYSDQ